MTVSLAERARQGRMVALEAIKVKKPGADIVLLSDRRQNTRPVFASRRADPSLLVA